MKKQKQVIQRNQVVRVAITRSWGAGSHNKSCKAVRRQEKINLTRECRV